MIKEVLQTDQINTDADSSIKGIGLQKIRAAERLLRALLENKRAVFCTIEHVDDVLEVDVEQETTNYRAKQIIVNRFLDEQSRSEKFFENFL